MMTIRPILEMTPVQALSHLDACMFCSFGWWQIACLTREQYVECTILSWGLDGSTASDLSLLSKDVTIWRWHALNSVDHQSLRGSKPITYAPGRHWASRVPGIKLGTCGRVSLVWVAVPRMSFKAKSTPGPVAGRHRRNQRVSTPSPLARQRFKLCRIDEVTCNSIPPTKHFHGKKTYDKCEVGD
jgi:hypothetical protein